MKFAMITLLLAIFSSQAYAQKGPDDSSAVQRSSNPGGIQIQGNAQAGVASKNGNTTAPGANNNAITPGGTINGTVHIQGTTRINAHSRDVNSIAVGKNNKAGNAVGSIGGK